MILVTVVEKKIDGYTVGQEKKGERGDSCHRYIHFNARQPRRYAFRKRRTYSPASTEREPSHLSSFSSHYYLSTFGPGPRRAPGIGNERSIVPVGALSDGKRGEVRGRGWRRTRNEKESE